MISVLFPTVRPQQMMKSFDTIRPAADGVPYEVIVVADFGPELLQCNNLPDHLSCRWLERPRRGPIAAVEQALQMSQGEYVFVFNDESALDPTALRVLYEEASKEPRVLYSPRHVPAFEFVYYGKPFAAFPFVHRDVLTEVGGLFDTAYRGFYADPDLSMRAHLAGIPVRVVGGAVIRHGNNMNAPVRRENQDAYFVEDRNLFRSRWDHLGAFKDP